MMKKLSKLIGYATLAAALASPIVMAQDIKKGDVLVRVRGIYVAPDESATISVIGGTAAIDSAKVPELDISYFLTDKVAVELILATTKHSPVATGTALGNVPLGSVYLLPPTLTLQYHPMAGEKFSPYVGAGLNYTMFYSVKEPAAVVTDIDYSNSFGYSLQAGADFWVNDKWFLNLDVKKLWLNTNVKINSNSINADVTINPLIVGFGIGTKF